MDALHTNIKKLKMFDDKYKGIDNYYQTFIDNDTSLKSLVKTLSKSGSKNKMVQMDVPLTAEYLRNVGYDIPKPDRHICRILGKGYLSLSSKQPVPQMEAFDIVRVIADEIEKSYAKVDYILWSYCADGYGGICASKHPQYEICVAKDYCKHQCIIQQR